MPDLDTPVPNPKGSQLVRWLHENRTRRTLTVNAISFADCREWSYSNGSLIHRTGRFFSIVGCKFEGNMPHLEQLEQPMINQPEIGILGFVIRQTDTGWEWLVQAKAEPGNVHGFQGAPTVQATKSNYEIVHKGQPTPFLHCFTDKTIKGVNLLADIHQSEQGDRFINKFNRNCVATVPEDYSIPENGLHEWYSVSEIRSGLISDFILNTDARSVLFCSDWQLLCDIGTTPFSKWKDSNTFGSKLFSSFSSDTYKISIDDLYNKIQMVRESTEINLEYVALDQLNGWEFNERALKANHEDASFLVRVYSAHIKSREVERWCQPLVESITPIKIALVSTEIEGVLYFFLRLSPEPGFKDKIQLGPSLVDDPNHFNVPWCINAIEEKKTIKHMEVHQSDEGGRFMNSVVVYQIYEIDPKWCNDGRNDGVWLTLAQLSYLASVKGSLTNETRSILSMLLAWV